MKKRLFKKMKRKYRFKCFLESTFRSLFGIRKGPLLSESKKSTIHYYRYWYFKYSKNKNNPYRIT